MDGRSNFRYILLVFPTAIVALDLLFFFLDDFLDEGRSLFYFDNYGQGYFTWWLDFERFWGNAELWVLGIGVWMGFFTAFAFGAAPGTVADGKAKLVKWPIFLLAAVLGFATIAGLASWFSPVPYSIGVILVNGWYPEYFAENVLFLLIVFSGIWLLIPAVSKLRRGRLVMPLSVRMAVALVIPALVMLHLAIASTWSVVLVNNLYTPLVNIIGLFFITTPLFAFMLASIERKTGHASTPARIKDAKLDLRRKMHSWLIMSILLGILGAILLGIGLTAGLDTDIDINSSFIPRNFLTWIATALVATITFFIVQGGRQK
ncbi:MAG: hypothetical protein Q6373_024825 [Candidatus Sigynarchaeota archaeon]